MILNFDDYRQFLREVLLLRIRRNSRYSMRMMAKSLDLAPSYLSTVLKGRKNFSPDTTSRVAEKLGLSGSEAEYLDLLVQKASAKSSMLQETILTRLRRIRPDMNSHDLSVDQFRLIADWIHFGLLAALEISDANVGQLARILRVSQTEADLALERLERLHLVRRSTCGIVHKLIDSPRVVSPDPDESLRSFHRQMLNKAIESLDTQSPQEKVMGSETFAIDHSQIEEFRNLADRFFDEALAMARKARCRDSVYHLGVQFFSLTSTPALAVAKTKKEETL